MSAITATPAAHEPYHAHNPWYFFTTSGGLGYALRTSLAGVGSLIVAMWLQLDVPRWAILTTIIVSPPVRGNALRKSAARVGGTIIGCIVGVLLVALFPQDRIGFILVFGLWLGFCAYWATLRRGFVAYTAVLAAFTSAIVAANVSDAPQDVFNTAIDRGSATILGIAFALLVSEAAARSDDAAGDLANRICQVVANLLDWAAKQLATPAAAGLEDAPSTSAILGLDELNLNAMAERPALRWVKSWITGLPTALLSLQSEVIAAARMLRTDQATRPDVDRTREAISAVRKLLVTGAGTPIPDLRREANALARLRAELPDDDACARIVAALQFLVVSIDAILTQKEPRYVQTRRYPAPRFLPQRRRARINFARAIVGITAGFLIWDATAWSQGEFFLVNVSVALVIYLSLDNPLALNFRNLLGATIGAAVGLAAYRWILPWSNDPLWLAVVMFACMYPGVWSQTRPDLVVPGITYVFVSLTILEPSNPQQYDYAGSLNVAISVIAAYAFVPTIFLLIGAPKTGTARIEQLLERMRKHIRIGLKRRSMDRFDRLQWDTAMYDGLQQLQAETPSTSARAAAIELLMSGRQMIATAHSRRAAVSVG